MASLPLRFFCFLTLTVSIGIQSVQGQSGKIRARADQAKILNCVEMVMWDGQMGFMDIIGDSGFSLLIGNATVAAGGRIGKGRVIGFAHGSFLFPQLSHSDKKSDTLTFLRNMFDWVSLGKKDKAVVVRDFGAINDTATLKNYFQNVQMNAIEPEKAVADVMVVDGLLKAEEVPFFMDRVTEGMGLILMATNWWQKKYYSSEVEFRTNYAPDIIGRAAGFTYRYSDTKAGDGQVDVKYWAAIPKQCHKAVRDPRSL